MATPQDGAVSAAAGVAAAGVAADQPHITLYWLNESRSQRIVWLLEELGVSYSIEVFHRTQDNLAPREFEKIHPLGKFPVVKVTLPEASLAPKKELILAESGFITEYLCGHFGQEKDLVPSRYPKGGHDGEAGTETESWMRYQYFLHYAEASLMPPLVISVILSVLKGSKVPFFIRPITGAVADKVFAGFVTPTLAKHFAYLESQLETAPNGGGYLCGKKLTAVDILLVFPLVEAKKGLGHLDMGGGKGKLRDNFPKLWEYVTRLEAEPGYKRAAAKIEEVEGKPKL
ncbi:hypothetical protein B0H63DRAFT_480540 [Podospora didyma]|uniref:Glutathione S-transferase n=1 Tax=Podospora didyma TaxID=330526 RepID=A0AAE0N9P0_9PEZI|nr:hypothetical protein B0H63DRAFT_480540 [Podospora didyma]